MSIQRLAKLLIESGIEENEAQYEIKMFVEHFCDFTERDKLLGKQLTNEQVKLIEEKVQQRINLHTPIQYIIGKAWFMDNFFKVTPDVLIPRDETEILVREAINIIKSNNFEEVLDIGTGSGCIACTIAKNTSATVLGVDISTDALRVALDNVTNLNINNKAIFRKSDLFSSIREGEVFDLIISNPPYIPYGTSLSKEVQQEPSIALFAEENGLAIYRKIIEQAPQYLIEGGYLMFELGIDESDDVKSMMYKDFEDIQIKKDLAGIDRVIWGRLR